MPAPEPVDPADWPRHVDQWLAGHDGVISIPRAVKLGAPRRTIYDAVASGRFEIVLPGVLRSNQSPPRERQQWAAAVARNPRALVAFITAAREWGMRQVGTDRRLHLLVPHGCSPVMTDVVVHRCRRIDPVDITVRDGLRVTSPPRTLFDCADMLGFAATVSNLEQLIDKGRGTFETHLDCWLRLGQRRRPGTRTMAAVLRSRPAWQRALQSDLEVRVLAEIARQALPPPVPQWPMRLADGRNIRVDFAWPELRIALEVDHPFWHTTDDAWHRDRSRDRLLIASGWSVPRLTDRDVSTGLDGAIAQVATIIRQREAG